MKIEPAVKALIEKDGKYLVLKDKDFWDLPGGRIQFGEEIHIALKREVKEETGLSFETAEIFSVNDKVFQDGGHRVFMFFKCSNVSGTIKLSHEHDTAVWMTEEEIREKCPDWLSELFKVEQEHEQHDHCC